VNLHAGFQGARGFHTHWDGHDVFAVQLEGKKKWRLFGFTEQAPLAVPPDAKHGAPTNHVWEGVLDRGDMLYLPRGYWHATEFVDDASLHLTFAVQHPTAIEFLHWLTARYEKELVIRRDIPAAIFDLKNIGMSAKMSYLHELRELVLRSVSEETLTEFVEEFRQTLGRVNHLRLVPKGRNVHVH
jgi:ribosomal protein L16 Arg81 hydroxylase